MVIIPVRAGLHHTMLIIIKYYGEQVLPYSMVTLFLISNKWCLNCSICKFWFLTNNVLLFSCCYCYFHIIMLTKIQTQFINKFINIRFINICLFETYAFFCSQRYSYYSPCNTGLSLSFDNEKWDELRSLQVCGHFWGDCGNFSGYILRRHFRFSYFSLIIITSWNPLHSNKKIGTREFWLFNHWTTISSIK